eukprot:CAMPEP_0170594244 /NCGR_PEP_ID=MMETSP0224-20130122/13895_1 /TAXON_ID=285029 /ORGANISM="Togula jolla, Strain CCCM 725" /LENGTH=143 /DNA_ID=CAMNT_0010918285 /DNA_START=78 /DNA_END=505 /DNA_ORIENTATION=-
MRPGSSFHELLCSRVPNSPRRNGFHSQDCCTSLMPTWLSAICCMLIAIFTEEVASKGLKRKSLPKDEEDATPEGCPPVLTQSSEGLPGTSDCLSLRKAITPGGGLLPSPTPLSSTSSMSLVPSAVAFTPGGGLLPSPTPLSPT